MSATTDRDMTKVNQAFRAALRGDPNVPTIGDIPEPTDNNGGRSVTVSIADLDEAARLELIGEIANGATSLTFDHQSPDGTA